MNETFIEEVLSNIPKDINEKDRLVFESVLRKELVNKKVLFDVAAKEDVDNSTALNLFLSAKKIEGCSDKTSSFYRTTIELMMNCIDKNYQKIGTNDIRDFLAKYQAKNNASKVTVDNVRRIVSSFFGWLEVEDYILKSPVRRIKKVKIGKRVKDTYSNETIELLRENAKNIRDLAIIDFLHSTGVRVGELVKLNKEDIDYLRRECIVNGKGNKQRKVYFDATAKIHLAEYVNSRKDCNQALFCSLQSPFKRLQISGVEILLRKIGKKAGIDNVHPHKFRRSLATKAIDKGMPIEQVQRLLGHSQIDTTLEYAMVDDSNVKLSHKKYLE